jgi:hypothetical protein
MDGDRDIYSETKGKKIVISPPIIPLVVSVGDRDIYSETKGKKIVSISKITEV